MALRKKNISATLIFQIDIHQMCLRVFSKISSSFVSCGSVISLANFTCVYFIFILAAIVNRIAFLFLFSDSSGTWQCCWCLCAGACILPLYWKGLLTQNPQGQTWCDDLVASTILDCRWCPVSTTKYMGGETLSRIHPAKTFQCVCWTSWRKERPVSLCSVWASDSQNLWR